MLNDEVCRAMTDKQTNEHTNKHTYWVKTEETFFKPPSFFIFYFYLSNSLNVKKAVSNRNQTDVLNGFDFIRKIEGSVWYGQV